MKFTEIVLVVLIMLPVRCWSAGEQPPDPELLEFLGQFETSGGKTVDPFLFRNTDVQKRDKKQPVAAKADRKRKKLPCDKERKDCDDDK